LEGKFPGAAEELSLEAERNPGLPPVRRVGARVAELRGSAPARDLALLGEVGEPVIDVPEGFQRAVVKGGIAREGPGLENAVAFEEEVPVVRGGGVFLEGEAGRRYGVSGFGFQVRG
jgi:hypothetical protein